MNLSHTLPTSLAMLLVPALCCAADEPDPAIVGLEKTAAAFVTAFNDKDAAALAALFTEEGELCGAEGEDLTSGREQIQAHYADVFSDDRAPTLAIEVKSVRLVTPTLAIEDGLAHYTPTDEGGEAPPQSISYTAVLAKNADGAWQIASSRRLRDATTAAGRLSDLQSVLKGDWTGTRDGVRMDLAFGWDSSAPFSAVKC